MLKKTSSECQLRAVLGPTNTGKTHYAMERMLAHRSGMIGFPLRLLARENYEKAIKIVGKSSVALITGEEKIIPENARFFCCTVESMPVEKKVSFLSVDEVQLAGDHERGHIFTDRLLNARGLEETVFLGSEIIKDLIKVLLPKCKIETRPRLSSLIFSTNESKRLETICLLSAALSAPSTFRLISTPLSLLSVLQKFPISRTDVVSVNFSMLRSAQKLPELSLEQIRNA